MQPHKGHSGVDSDKGFVEVVGADIIAFRLMILLTIMQRISNECYGAWRFVKSIPDKSSKISVKSLMALW